MIDKIRVRMKGFMSLNFKIGGVLVIALVIAVGIFFLCTVLEVFMANRFYLSEAATERSAGEAYASFIDYVEENQVKGTDSAALSKWVKEQSYTYVLVYDNYENVFESGWWVEDTGETSSHTTADEEINVTQNNESGERISKDTFEETASNRIVDFADGSYYVYIMYYGEERLYNIMNVVRIVLFLLSFIITLFVYNSVVTGRIINLSNEVKKISDGDLENKIIPTSNDEIGTLAVAVDDMRNSIIEKLQNEKEAWEANAQLITSMSHDIRTPLTSLIGYLDIIEGEKYESSDQYLKYVHSCREKAFQLKDLSDKLFQYFLVFGSPESERELEIINGGILFQQLLLEHVAEVISYEYKVNFNYTVPDVNVEAELSGLQRLFDNIFSNLMKYADRSKPISIEGYFENNKIHLEFINNIAPHAKKVESTKIGVKTCERICMDMKGSFKIIEKEDVYKTIIAFPAIENSPELEEPQQGEC